MLPALSHQLCTQGNVSTEGADRGPYVPVAALHGPSQVQAQILLS